jgi:hypothetical protein
VGFSEAGHDRSYQSAPAAALKFSTASVHALGDNSVHFCRSLLGTMTSG